jgi:hypothetical protein
MDKDTSEDKRKRKNRVEKGEKQPRGDKSIRLFFTESDYCQVVGDVQLFRRYLDNAYALYPELFPRGFHEGYVFHDQRESVKIKGLIIRRIMLSNGEAYSIIPSDTLPYLVGKTSQVDKGLVLRRYGVPYEVIAYVLDRDAMYWERIEDSLGRISIVGCVCKRGLPAHLAADEKVSFWNRQEIYVAMTASGDCLLGAEISMSEDAEGLTQAYGVFLAEARDVDSTYSPISVNVDGWKSTVKAWADLFPGIALILCFLHSFIKIRNIAKNLKDEFREISTRLWDAYAQKTAAEFAQSLIDLKQWAAEKLTLHQHISLKINEIVDKSAKFERAYQYPECYRTSNQIDRPMNDFDRYLYSMKYFHGHRTTANKKIRGWTILYNFVPFSQKTRRKKKPSRFEERNQFAYHQHWLQNLLIAASCNAKNLNHKIR